MSGNGDHESGSWALCHGYIVAKSIQRETDDKQKIDDVSLVQHRVPRLRLIFNQSRFRTEPNALAFGGRVDEFVK